MHIRWLIIALLILCAPVSAAIIGETTTIVYKDAHFSVDVPVSSDKHSYTLAAGENVHDLYISGGCAYDIRVLKPSSDLLASTFIEKIIQEQVKSGSALGSTSRWELDSKSKILFKGYSRFIDMTDPLLQKLFGGTRCFEGIAMSALGDELSAIIAVGVIGKIEQATDVENLAKFTAFSIGLLPAQPAVASSPGQIISGTSPNLISPGSKPKLSAQTKPTAPDSPITRKPGILNDGEIELNGVVESIDIADKSLVILVDQVTMPGSKPIKLSPPRQKTVLFSKLPGDISKGKRITVIGANNGAGSAIEADILIVQ